MKPATAGLPAVLRQLRTFRGRSAQSVAKAMEIPLRTYQRAARRLRAEQR